VVGGVPSTLLGSSAPTTINTFYPNWASINLTSANITLSSPASFMVAIEYVTGSSGSTPAILMDGQSNIATGKNYFSLNGGVTWIEHYSFWQGPGSVGHNMIRATINNTSQSPAEYKVYLPGISINWSPPPPPSPPPPGNIPCLFVIGQELAGQPLPLYAGCTPQAGTSLVITPHYNSQGALIGLDYILRGDQNTIVYQAKIDIQRKSNGQIKSYGGEISGKNFPTFTESITNNYNSQGGLIGADDVTKMYGGGFQYKMDIRRYCPNAIGPLTGYKVKYNTQQTIIGACS
jgi:hypothetical protein